MCFDHIGVTSELLENCELLLRSSVAVAKTAFVEDLHCIRINDIFSFVMCLVYFGLCTVAKFFAHSEHSWVNLLKSSLFSVHLGRLWESWSLINHGKNLVCFVDFALCFV